MSVLTPEYKEILLNPIQLKHQYPFRALLVADLHHGNPWGLAPPVFERKNGITMGHNKTQSYIWKQFQNAKQVADEYKVQYIFSVGDLIQGEDRIEHGGKITCDIRDQKKMAVQSLEYLADGHREVNVLSGTRYHSLPMGQGDPEEDIVDTLRANGTPADFLKDMAYVTINGLSMKRLRRLFIVHEAPTALVYPATLMSRDINWALMSEAQGKTPKVDAIIRAHIHTWLHLDQGRKHAVQLPGFSAFTPYKTTRKFYFKLQPDVGFALLLADQEGRLRFFHYLMPQEDYLAMTHSIVETKALGIDHYKKVIEKCLLEK